MRAGRDYCLKTTEEDKAGMTANRASAKAIHTYKGVLSELDGPVSANLLISWSGFWAVRVGVQSWHWFLNILWMPSQGCLQLLPTWGVQSGGWRNYVRLHPAASTCPMLMLSTVRPLTHHPLASVVLANVSYKMQTKKNNKWSTKSSCRL